MTTAIGLVMSVMSMLLLVACNALSRRLGGEGIW
jgi:ABC-type polysaccharide transport system permease subunit